MRVRYALGGLNSRPSGARRRTIRHPEGVILYFTANRPRPEDSEEPTPDAWPATVRKDLYHRDYDLYAVVVTDSGVGETLAVATLNSSYNEGEPYS